MSGEHTMENGIELVAGLGNPGAEYTGTRHNLGFAVVERLLKKLPRGMESSRGCNSVYWHGRCAGRHQAHKPRLPGHADRRGNGDQC